MCVCVMCVGVLYTVCTYSIITVLLSSINKLLLSEVFKADVRNQLGKCLIYFSFALLKLVL